MGFNFLLIVILLVRAVLNKLPQTLCLVLVHNKCPLVFWFFYLRSFTNNSLFIFLIFLNFQHFLWQIQVDRLFFLREVHIAIRRWMINFQSVVKVHFVVLILEAPW